MWDLELKTVRQIYLSLVNLFKNASIPDPEIDAAILFHYVLGLTRSDLVIKSAELVGADEALKILELANKRLSREPIAYLVGEQDFYGRRFVVNPSVLIPRPETELIVEKAISTGKELIDSRQSLTIMDLGTGSGAIAVTLAKELRSSKLFALDRSISALQTAKINAANHGVLHQLEFVASDWFNAFTPKASFNIVISNPPYVAEKIRKDLQKELSFEPASALFSGTDGTNDLKKIISNSSPYLAPGGFLFVEIGYDQKEFVLDFIGKGGFFEDFTVYDDYAGLPRILKAKVKG
nr:peptide chain release factor N(5)-glutamine methyltransferase [Desulfobulbaceae bacterium]